MSKMPARWRAPAQRTVVAVFVALWVASMSLYPGGNIFAPGSDGHDFTRNFLCDLLTPVTADGRGNAPGAALMNVAVVALTIGGLLPLWWRASSNPLWRSTARSFGAAAAVLIGAICVDQAFGLRWSHNAVTLCAGALGLAPTAMVAATDWRAPRQKRLRRALLLGTMAASLVNFVSYALVQLGNPLTPVVPISQKVALLGLLGWMSIDPVGRPAAATSPPGDGRA